MKDESGTEGRRWRRRRSEEGLPTDRGIFSRKPVLEEQEVGVRGSEAGRPKIPSDHLINRKPARHSSAIQKLPRVSRMQTSGCDTDKCFAHETEYFRRVDVAAVVHMIDRVNKWMLKLLRRPATRLAAAFNNGALMISPTPSSVILTG